MKIKANFTVENETAISAAPKVDFGAPPPTPAPMQPPATSAAPALPPPVESPAPANP
jgi:LemA protein